MPDCLRYTGNIPAGWMQTSRSKQMYAEPAWVQKIPSLVAMMSPQTAAAPGPAVQTAARAGAFAVAVALTLADSAIAIITDNKGVWSKLRNIHKG